ncbi:MAG: DUF4954 family protein [Candidatus Firestonebacteria bacterium]
MLEDILKNSELINECHKIKRHEGKNLRKLKKEEIIKLEQNGNHSSDWNKIKVNIDFNPLRVFNSTFYGEIMLGSFKENIKYESADIPSGIYNSTIINCEIGNNVLIKDVKLLSNYIINAGAILINNGTITADSKNTFGNGIEMSLCIETGGREIYSFAEITVEIAEKITKSRGDKKLLEEFKIFIDKYLSLITINKGYIGKNVRIINTPEVRNSFMGDSAKVINALRVNNCTLLSNDEEKTEISYGASVSDSILQWGSEVTTMGIVSSSILVEHSHVERHGKVNNSLLGPNTGVGEGEVTSCLLGPFIGFHHQALLTAAFWPEGKGNVGYGANVGSNHTSRAPDQEVWPGEGTFFGLGVSIKFPSNFTKAPYTIISTAVSALPQKVTFPFSLINLPANSFPGISPAFNEIFPGWVLLFNIFALKRNEGKYIKRNKAKRCKFAFEVFRPDIIDLIIDARRRLQNIKDKKEVYTNKDIDGLGKNYMLEESKAVGIKVYDFYIKYYALSGLKRKLEEHIKKNETREKLKEILNNKTDDSRWEHEKKILNSELKDLGIKKCLEKLIEMQEKVAKDVQISKEKDDERGKKIIDDYDLAHGKAIDDNFVKETRKTTEKLKEEIKNIINKIKK